jgi:hypothetical protein
MSTDTPTPYSVPATTPQQDQLMQRLSGLQEAMLAADPDIKTHMREIHKLLIGFEELVHLLSDEEIGVIMKAQQGLTHTALVGTVTAGKTKASNSKKAAGISLGDL